MTINYLALNLAVDIIFGAVFLWLGMLFVNKFMLNAATAVTCPFWKLVLAVAAGVIVRYIPIPILNFIASIIVFYYLLMKFTDAPLIELVIIVIISNIGSFIGIFALGTSLGLIANSFT